ncbi:MAG: hypothetical protein IJI47_07675 [Eubacterium sp.]|nr:hypothetical protein [Eubacterium sp.]
MKRIIAFVLAITAITASFAGCSGGKAPAEKATTAKAAAKIDYDLSGVSETVAYSQVYDMIMKPDDYRGKTVKVKGEFEYADDELNGDTHYSCIVSDTKGCCKQGIEFATKEDMDFADYPVIFSKIEVTGTFDTYNIGNSEAQCVILKDATIKEL